MRCLVTGGAGFIGTNLIKRLLKDNYEVVSVDNYSTGLRENEQEGCTYISGDVRDLEFWGGRLEKMDIAPDVIFHLAAKARIQPSITDPVECLENNFNSTLHILEYARQNNIQIIYAGSSSKHHGIFNSPYAWSKHDGEQLCKLYSEVYDLNTTICRFYNVYGEYHIKEGAYATVLGVFENQYLDNQPLTITSDGEQRRDFTHVDDIADGLVKCIGRDFRAEEFELGTGVNYSINELAKMFGNTYPTKYLPLRPGEYDVTLCDYSKAENLLGYKPKGDLETYVKNWLEGNK
tara:strand:- start:46 stop:918 length:873 start_codon:yes stop_codon:yes gene_type:complete